MELHHPIMSKLWDLGGRTKRKVNYDNELDPDNVMQYDDVLPSPSSLTFGFYGIDPWSQSGKLPVGRAKMKMNLIPRIQHMSCINFPVKFYFMEYIMYLVIPKTNKHLN